MSWDPALEPGCPDEVGIDAIETLIVPRSRDLSGFEVRRALPAPKRQMVGPFIFVDQAGPAELWNFVASSRERIEEAKAEWRAESWGKGRFDLPIYDRDEHILLPD
jgi:redox-sensitive bicupin YhaK (pirin superfamily)